MSVSFSGHASLPDDAIPSVEAHVPASVPPQCRSAGATSRGLPTE